MSIMISPNPETLKRRVRYFFETPRRGRPAVQDFVRELLKLGQTAILGGMLRELALGSNEEFCSDIDFVVIPESIFTFQNKMEALGASKNKFDGYRLHVDKWRVDVWPLSETWAVKNGLCKLDNFSDLLVTTFFDWDAILFDIAQNKLATKADYFLRLENKIIDVNLLSNPNPLGNAIRALRYAYTYKASFGHRLATHVLEHIHSTSWAEMLLIEQRSFYNSVLTLIDPDLIKNEIEAQLSLNKKKISLSICPEQYELCA